MGGGDAICLFLRSVLCVSLVEEYQHSWLAGNPEFAPVGSFRSWRKIKNKEPGDWDEEENVKTNTKTDGITNTTRNTKKGVLKSKEPADCDEEEKAKTKTNGKT